MKNTNSKRTIKKIIIFLLLIPCSLSLSAQSWHPLGKGVDNDSVMTITVYNNKLIVGGAFDSVGTIKANAIASWDGNQWDSLESGMHLAVNTYKPFVAALTAYNGKLYAGGFFGYAGNIFSNHFAEWDSTHWDSVSNQFPSCIVYSLTGYDGNIVLGGTFNYCGFTPTPEIGQWTGSCWMSLDFGLNQMPNALTVYNGDLIAGGSFTIADNAPVNHISLWNGAQWFPMGKGLNGEVLAMTVWNGCLYAGGVFDSAGGVAVNNLAKWDGSKWSDAGSGTNGAIFSLCVYKNRLVAGGWFTQAGGQPANNIAIYNDTAWAPLGSGINGIVNSLTEYDGNLYAGGYFTEAGGDTAKGIAEWTDNWASLSVNETETNSALVSLYPNPNNGVFNLSISNYQLGMNSRVEIYNVLGEKVYSSQISLLNTQISLPEVSGIYIYRILTDDGKMAVTGKFVIEK